MAVNYSKFRTYCNKRTPRKKSITSYFIVHDYDDAAIKIGHTDYGFDGVIDRLSNFNTSTFREFCVVAYTDRFAEAELHKLFSDIRVRKDREFFFGWRRIN